MADFSEIFDHILKQMADGDANWEMPWHGKNVRPINIVHGRPYLGVNRLILMAKAKESGFKSRHWGTFNQWRKVRQGVGKGSKAATLIIPKIEKNEKAEDVLVGFRRYWVFNGDQVLNRNESHPDMFGHAVEDIPKVEEFVASLGATIHMDGKLPCYFKQRDLIEMPSRESFLPTRFSTSTQNWYATLLHELVHWTGHATRENRKPVYEDKALDYAFEELVAELGAAFMCSEFELEDVPRKDHAQYLNSWFQILKEKPAALWRASTLAQTAVSFLLKKPAVEPDNDDSQPSWFTHEPIQVDMLAPLVLGTGKK